jgi:hypothetical protein
MLSLPTQFKWIYFLDLAQLKDLLPLMQLKPMKGTIVIDTRWSILPLDNWSIWLLTQTCWYVFTQLHQYHLELERLKGPSSFYLGHFSLSKSFNHIPKDANIHHLKLGCRCRLSYFSTSTFQDAPPITTADLLQAINFLHINMANLPQAVNYKHGEIFTPTLNQLNVLSLFFFLIWLLCTFS